MYLVVFILTIFVLLKTTAASCQFDILVGDCDLHERSIDVDWPVNKFVGGKGIFQKLVEHLNDTCNTTGECGSQVIYIANGEAIPVDDMQEMIDSFANQKMCSTLKFGGTWFIISTCICRELTKNLELEGSESINDVDASVQSELRKIWPNMPRLHEMVKITWDESPDGNFDEIVGQTIHELKSHRNHSKTPPPQVSGFDNSGFTGQRWAQEAVWKALDAVQQRLKYGNSPLVFFFLGPPGTGKTMLARILARAYHGGEKISVLEMNGSFRIFAMASFKSEEDVDSFISPRAGLVGEGSMIDVFSNSLKPVIVLDEIEKAHPRLTSSLLLSWLDEDGFVQDKKNASKKFPTKDAIFILTSNCYSNDIAASSRANGGDARRVSDDIAYLMTHQVRREGCDAFLREDIMRRMKAGHAMSDLSKYGFVVFLPPTMEEVDTIVERFMGDYREKHEERGTAELYWTSRAMVHLKQRARKVASETTGSGGVSGIQTELSGELTRLVRLARTKCPKNHGEDMLIYEKNEQLMVAVVNCRQMNEPPESGKSKQVVSLWKRDDDGGGGGIAGENLQHEQNMDDEAHESNELDDYFWVRLFGYIVAATLVFVYVVALRAIIFKLTFGTCLLLAWMMYYYPGAAGTIYKAVGIMLPWMVQVYFGINLLILVYFLKR